MSVPTSKLRVLIAPLTSTAILPRKAHPSDAGFDLAIPGNHSLSPRSCVSIDLGFALQIPPGWYGQIFARSSVFRRGLSVHPGVIDADYRGTVQLLVYNPLTTEQRVQRGERLAQLLLLPVPDVTWIQVPPQDLGQTSRGTGGIGSTGR